MSIKYYVVKEKLLGEVRNIGKVAVKTAYSTDMVIERIMEANTTLTKIEIESVLTGLAQAVLRICSEGSSVNIEGFLAIKPSISGTFEYETSTYDKGKNEIYTIARMSSTFNNNFKSIAELEKIDGSEKHPLISEVIDYVTDDINGRVTQEGIVTLLGNYLKIDTEDSECGLYIVNADNTGETTKIEKFQKNKDSELVFMMPTVSYTKCYFELLSKMTGSKIKKGDSTELTVVTKS